MRSTDLLSAAKEPLIDLDLCWISGAMLPSAMTMPPRCLYTVTSLSLCSELGISSKPQSVTMILCFTCFILAPRRATTASVLPAR